MTHTSTRNLVVGIIFVFMFMVNFGGLFTAEAMMNSGMHNCPFMGVSGACNMSLAQHMSEWQQMFTGTAQHTSFLLLIPMLFVLLSYFRVKIADTSHYSLLRQSRRKKIFDPFQSAFSQGLIHSKAY